jgi:hypothetical protein
MTTLPLEHCIALALAKAYWRGKLDDLRVTAGQAMTREAMLNTAAEKDSILWLDQAYRVIESAGNNMAGTPPA